MTVDAVSLQRTAQRPVALFRRWTGSGYADAWDDTLTATAMVASIIHNIGAKPNEATLLFADLRWHLTYNLQPGDRVRIQTDAMTVIFDGFLTSRRMGFSGGVGADGSGAWERNALLALDYRWMYNSTSPVYGQIARSPDDFTAFGEPGQTPIDNAATFMSGRRCIFNADGRPNRDPVDLTLSGSLTYPGAAQSMPIFAPAGYVAPTSEGDPQYFTLRQMIQYVLSPYYNPYWSLLAVADPLVIVGITHADFDAVIAHVSVEGLGVIDALARLLNLIGWTFRQADSILGPGFVFFKSGRAAGTVRTAEQQIILHELHAPAVAEDLVAAVAAGKKLLTKGELIHDIASVVNNPVGVGAPDLVEITAELVPAWDDGDLVLDDSDNYTHLFYTEAELAEMENPDAWDYYKCYHTRGSAFKRDVGRKWALNESGAYSVPAYDRGAPFDLTTVVPETLIKQDDHRMYGLFKRALMPCLTFDKDSLNTVGIRVEFSFDGGTSWEAIPCVIENLPDEGGIRIAEPNLADILPKTGGVITDAGSPILDKELNFFTSLANDKFQLYGFKDGEWLTRVRVTACIQLDQRLRYASTPSTASGSPLMMQRLYDFSDRYSRKVRAAGSAFYESGLPAWEVNQGTALAAHLDAIRHANEDASINSAFEMDRLWLDAADAPTFEIGDGVYKITGREVSLYTALPQSGDAEPAGVYPEIVQIIYDIEKQTQSLVTRDLRLAPNP